MDYIWYDEANNDPQYSLFRSERSLSPTVVTYCTPDFRFFAEGIQSDCQRLGISFYCKFLPANFRNVINAFDYKISFLELMVERFNTVLWLDVECRLHRAVPQNWSAPLISSYDFAGKAGLSSGVLMLDKRHSDLLSIWKYYAHKYTKQPDDFVLEFLLEEFGWPFQFVPLDFCSRQSTAQVIRGEWSNETTIVSHPSTNRWPYPRRYRRAFNGWWSSVKNINRLRKHIYYRNFAGNFSEVDWFMRNKSSIGRFSGWTFDGANGTYSPEFYWPQFKAEYFCKPRTPERSKSVFFNNQKSSSYRSRAIRKMKLDASHRLTERRAAKSN